MIPFLIATSRWRTDASRESIRLMRFLDSPAGPLEEQFFRERLVYDSKLDVLHVRFELLSN